MLIVETIAEIRRLHFRDGVGIKEISRKLGLSRNTVRKVIRSEVTAHSYERGQQPMPRLGEYVKCLDVLLEEDWQRSKKRRLPPVDSLKCFRKRVMTAGMTVSSVM